MLKLNSHICVVVSRTGNLKSDGGKCYKNKLKLQLTVAEFIYMCVAHYTLKLALKLELDTVDSK